MMRAIIVTIMCAVIATATNDFYQMKALVQSPNEYTPIISSFSELLFHGNLNKINATIIRRFRLIDTDSSGAISLQEFVLATRTVNYRVMRNNKLNISRDEYIQGPATDDERLIWEGMDTNNDNLVEFTEYMNSKYVRWNDTCA
jgi:hypothetical protein